MRGRWLRRGLVAAVLVSAVWLVWNRLQPPERTGSVPYVPTRPLIVDEMLDLAAVGPDDLFYDLGSGDGRIVIGAAGRGALAHGVELDPQLVAESRRNATDAGTVGRALFFEGDLFETDLREATVVTLYLLPTVNLALRPKLLTELAPGSRVVSQSFDMEEWRPDDTRTIDLDPPTELYRWVIPAAAGGVWLGNDPGELSLRLSQSFQDLEGELTWRGEAMPVTGELSGQLLRVETMRPLSGGVTGVELTAVVDGGELLEGELREIREGADRAKEVSLRREAAAPAGVWEVSAGDGDFEPEWEMSIRSVDGRWTATRRRLDTRVRARALPGSPPESFGAASHHERRVRDFYVWGSSLYFVVGGADGEAPRVIYRGIVEGDRIAGTVNNGGRMITWAGRRSRVP